MNRIRSIRQKKGVSQRQLARLAGTSQQQIQRIETGKQSVRFDLALKLCDALGARLDILFPKTKQSLERIRKKGADVNNLDHESRAKMEEAGLDMDPQDWTFKYRLRGGLTGFLPVSGPEKKRLFRAIQNVDSSAPFVVFDSKGSRILLNLRHLTFCHFLFDPPTDESPEAELDSVRVILADGSNPLSFDVDADEYDSENEEDLGQFRGMLFMAETSVEEDEVFHFTDTDGETAFFRVHDVAMMEIPLWVVEPELLQDEEEGNVRTLNEDNR